MIPHYKIRTVSLHPVKTLYIQNVNILETTKNSLVLSFWCIFDPSKNVWIGPDPKLQRSPQYSGNVKG